MDNLDISDKMYDRKYQDMQDRLNGLYDEIERLEHVKVEEAIEPQSGFVYHRPVKTEMITKVRLIK